MSADRTAASLVPRMLIGDRGVGAVGAHHVEVVGVVVAGHELVVGRARGVGPGAGRVDRRTCRSCPPVPACATKVAGLSTSLMVSVPEVLMSAAELVSVRLTCRPTEPPRHWCQGC